MNRSDGTICNIPEENAEVFQSYFQKRFNRDAIYDESVLKELPQYHIHQHCIIDQLTKKSELQLVNLRTMLQV